MRRPRLPALLMLAAVVAGACSGDDDTGAVPSSTTVEVSAPSTTGPPATTTSVAPTSTSLASTTIVPSPTTTAVPEFAGTVSEIDDALAARMVSSWREGCPVGLDELRYVVVNHWDDTGRVAIGELVIHVDWADEIVEVFRALFEAGFPIHQMRLIDDFGGSDPNSMAANNTSAFNCREVAYRPGVWSNHAFGTAIDINPLVNPYVDGSFVDPPEGAPYVDRSVPVPGGIYPGDAVTAAFTAIGWVWGGTWSGALDYQHFSANGR